MSKVTLEILTPKGVLVSPEVEGLKVPRVADLNGKTIGLLSEKPDSQLFFNTMERLLKKAYPTATILRFPSPANPEVPDNTLEVCAKCDCWLQGVKTSTSSRNDYDVRREKCGKPGVSFSVDTLMHQKRVVAEVNGLPTIRVVSVPSLPYFKAKADQALMDKVAEALFDETVAALTSPLTEAEMNPPQFVYDYSPIRFEGESDEDVYEQFQQYCMDNDMGDGLPLVPPTRSRVDEMLTGISYPPEKEIGVVLPRGGMATVEKIAINAVMAGAKPEYLPVIVAMVSCYTDKNFNQYHINTGPMPVTWISGPIIQELGISNYIDYMGPGHRVNNTIARASALCQINIGWRILSVYADPGGPGSPSNFTNFFVPENAELSPWGSYAKELGLAEDESVITTCECTRQFRGPNETLYYGSFEDSMELMASFFPARSSNYGMTKSVSENDRYLIILHPTFAHQLADAGYTKESFIQWIYDRNAIVWDKMDERQRAAFLQEVVDGKWKNLSPEECKSGLVLEPFHDASQFAIMISGSANGVTMVFGTSTGSTAKIADCAPDFEPRPFMHRVIHGATKTKYGK